MSLDRTLKSRSALLRHRNVLTRDERIEALNDEGRWNEETDSVFGLAKVTHRKTGAGKKIKKAKEKVPGTEEEAAAATESSTGE